MQSWECNRCTYRHHANATRCVMCNELRINREQMRDFITGKTINKHNNSTIEVPKQQQQQQQQSLPLSSEHISVDNETNDSHINRKNHTTTTTTASIGNSMNPPIATAQVVTTYNPYHNKPSRLSNGGSSAPSGAHKGFTGIVPVPPNTTHKPTTVKPTTDTENITTSNSTAASGTTTTMVYQKSSQKQGVIVATKRARSLSIGSNIVPSNKKIKKRQSSLFNTIRLPYQPGPVPYVDVYIDKWIYPVVKAYPKRQYQYDIACTAILHNTLVSLPTGLGKTLIASVVLYNFYRWFPTGKVLFLAPTLPLVHQQVQACYEIMGIPVSDTAMLTGKVPATQRSIIWNEKRVFFCTPQTVQRDLESNRCDALKVVCVVLDEAHKSTGEYAYCKVISHLEKAGAKFRVLGLSATPGTSIKAVQNVINVLRINCIEARSDNDPDVKQYIHDRQTEIIVVQGMDATKGVEQKIDAILGPLLETLRKRNVPLPQYTDYKSISSYTLLKTQAYIKNQPQNERDNAAIGYLAAGICFVQIRTDLYKHGIGSVRTKLHKLKNESQRGILSSIVKSDNFQLLFDEVETISCNPNAINNTMEDKYKNNPKLKKLCEILIDHFERSKSESISSRVIVFSQFRTSVSEIVDILNESKPLIRARHFIGQGKSGTNSNNSSSNVNSTSNNDKINDEPQRPAQQLIDGMKQDEQKNVITRFKDGTYNTLVCTSIGEEGLDIGEVDLIVNFDCLSSPIRTIQRVGRTGRKREGRVVTLVAEGQEERTLAKSQQNERTLIHALKNPKSFVVLPTNPMFPNDPIPLEQDMAIVQSFQMSQVNGFKRNVKVKKDSFSRDWKLNETEEFQRSCIVGQIDSVLGESKLNFSQLRRQFLSARSLSHLHHSNHPHCLIPHGRICKLIEEIENLYPIKVQSRTTMLRHQIQKLNERLITKPKELSIQRSVAENVAFSTTNDVENINVSLFHSQNRTIIAPDELSRNTTPSNLQSHLAQSASNELIDRQNHPTVTGQHQVALSVADNVPITPRSPCRVRFSLENSTVSKEISFTCDSQKLLAPARNKTSTHRFAIVDTQDSVNQAIPNTTDVAAVSKLTNDLQDTPETQSIDQFVCSICMTNDISEQNPIILCDGPGIKGKCDLIVHYDCYVAAFVISDNVEWFCDQCQYMIDGGKSENIICILCGQMNGIMKRLLNDRWKHIKCRSSTTIDRQNLHQQLPVQDKQQDLPSQSTAKNKDNYDSPGTLLRKRKFHRQLVMQQFIDYEAEASDVDDDDLEELALREIEDNEDELAQDFINDTSQLGYSPDQLDNLDDEILTMVNIAETPSMHRVLDIELEKKRQFATPVLNRRMIQRNDIENDSVQSESSKAPGSMRGLGNMNFVRSVLEHHRKGGNTDEIEQLYQELEGKSEKDSTYS